MRTSTTVLSVVVHASRAAAAAEERGASIAAIAQSAAWTDVNDASSAETSRSQSARVSSGVCSSASILRDATSSPASAVAASSAAPSTPRHDCDCDCGDCDCGDCDRDCGDCDRDCNGSSALSSEEHTELHSAVSWIAMPRSPLRCSQSALHENRHPIHPCKSPFAVRSALKKRALNTVSAPVEHSPPPPPTWAPGWGRSSRRRALPPCGGAPPAKAKPERSASNTKRPGATKDAKQK